MRYPLKIGILTFHEIFNPGAFLQCYGTQTLVRRMGHEPEIIHYNPPVHRYHPVSYACKLGWRLPYRWRNWMDAYLRDRAFSSARTSRFTVSPYFRHRSEISSSKYDVILIGSDIVWNFKDLRLGQDPVYFAEGLCANKVIAFAPSCGNCSVIDNIPEYVKIGLQSFTAIAVRDLNTAEIVHKACGVKPRVICDPSFHLMNEFALKENDSSDGGYILVYLLPGHTSSALIAEIKKLRTTSGLPIHAVYYRQKWADKNFMNLDPFQWLGKIRQARYVFTNTFHGTIFSAFTRSNFIVEMNEAIRSKTLSLILSCDLKQRLFTGELPASELLERAVDFDEVHNRFREQARESEAFLRNVLDENPYRS